MEIQSIRTVPTETDPIDPFTLDWSQSIKHIGEVMVHDLESKQSVRDKVKSAKEEARLQGVKDDSKDEARHQGPSDDSQCPSDSIFEGELTALPSFITNKHGKTWGKGLSK